MRRVCFKQRETWEVSLGKLIITLVLLCAMMATGCDAFKGPTGPPGPSATDNIIKLKGTIGWSRLSGYYIIEDSRIRDNATVLCYVDVPGGGVLWGTTEYAYSNGFVGIFDPSGILTGYNYLVTIMPAN